MISDTPKSPVTVTLRSAASSYPGLACNDEWITVLASHILRSDESRDTVGAGLMSEALKHGAPDAQVFEWDASCPSLRVGPPRMGLYVGSFTSSQEAMARCLSLPYFRREAHLLLRGATAS